MKANESYNLKETEVPWLKRSQRTTFSSLLFFWKYLDWTVWKMSWGIEFPIRADETRLTFRRTKVQLSIVEAPSESETLLAFSMALSNEEWVRLQFISRGQLIRPTLNLKCHSGSLRRDSWIYGRSIDDKAKP